MARTTPGIPATPAKDVTQVERVGGHPALDFANTVSWRAQDREIDYLRDHAALIAWSCSAGLMTAREAQRLERHARTQPRHAGAALARARGLRETIFRIGRAMARGEAPPADALERAHAARVEALRQARIARTGPGVWAPTWRATPPHLDRPWWPVAAAFATVLEHPEPHPLGVCPDCSWLFLDTSHNRSRRWCSSGDCGNRARGRRFRARHAST